MYSTPEPDPGPNLGELEAMLASVQLEIQQEIESVNLSENDLLGRFGRRYSQPARLSIPDGTELRRGSAGYANPQSPRKQPTLSGSKSSLNGEGSPDAQNQWKDYWAK